MKKSISFGKKDAAIAVNVGVGAGKVRHAHRLPLESRVVIAAIPRVLYAVVQQCADLKALIFYIPFSIPPFFSGANSCLP